MPRYQLIHLLPKEEQLWLRKYAGALSAQVALLTGAQLEVPAQQVVQVQRIMEAAYRSNDEKITVLQELFVALWRIVCYNEKNAAEVLL